MTWKVTQNAKPTTDGVGLWAVLDPTRTAFPMIFGSKSSGGKESRDYYFSNNNFEPENRQGTLALPILRLEPETFGS